MRKAYLFVLVLVLSGLLVSGCAPAGATSISSPTLETVETLPTAIPTLALPTAMPLPTEPDRQHQPTQPSLSPTEAVPATLTPVLLSPTPTPAYQMKIFDRPVEFVIGEMSWIHDEDGELVLLFKYPTNGTGVDFGLVLTDPNGTTTTMRAAGFRLEGPVFVIKSFQPGVHHFRVFMQSVTIYESGLAYSEGVTLAELEIESR